MDSGLKYLKELSIIEDKKASMVWNLVIIEQYLEDSQYENACKTMLEIADDLETVVELIKSNREMTIMKRPKKRTRTRRVPDGPVPDGPVPDGPVPDGPVPDENIEIQNDIDDGLARLREIKKRAEGRNFSYKFT